MRAERARARDAKVNASAASALKKNAMHNSNIYEGLVTYGVDPVKIPGWFKKPGQADEKPPSPPMEKKEPPSSTMEKKKPPSPPSVLLAPPYQPFKNVLAYKPHKKKKAEGGEGGEGGEEGGEGGEEGGEGGEEGGQGGQEEQVAEEQIGEQEEPTSFNGELRRITLQEVEVRTRAVMQKAGFNPSVTFAYDYLHDRPCPRRPKVRQRLRRLPRILRQLHPPRARRPRNKERARVEWRHFPLPG